MTRHPNYGGVWLRCTNKYFKPPKYPATPTDGVPMALPPLPLKAPLTDGGIWGESKE